MADTMESPGMAGMHEEPEGGQEEGAGELAIRIGSDGSLSVYGEGTAQMDEQPAQDIGEALKMLLDAYRGMNQASDDEEFDVGFGKPKQAGMGGMGKMGSM